MNRAKHSLSHYHLTTCNMGQLIPIGMTPVLPGDTLGHHTNLLIRVSPTAAPIMHQVDARVHHFNIPYRILEDPADATWSWEDLITGGVDGFDTSKVPTITTTGTPGDLLDYFGIPTVAGIEVNALPIYAFNFCFNEWYADQDLVSPRALNDLTIPNVAWAKDYFTTARPFSSKGPQISIPVGNQAPVAHDQVDAGFISAFSSVNNGNRRLDSSAATLTASPTVSGDANAALYADLSNATGADPIDVRMAWGLQRYFEEAARYGNRYPEKMRRLGSTYKGLMDRPEYLGGGQAPLQFSEVLQTANDTTDRDFGVGDMYGHGIAPMSTNKYARTIGEHGVVLSMMSVRPKSVYMNGMHREWLKQDREDFHDPFLELIGQQEVWLNEIYGDPTNQNAGVEAVFGFSDKYQEYRETQSYVSGEMRTSLNYWHMGRNLNTKPVLNESFVSCVPTTRIYNEQTMNNLWIMAHHRIAAHRNVVKNPTARLT